MSDSDLSAEADKTVTAESSHEPNIVTVHGKEFDVNDPIQKAQLSAWDEAHAKLIGRQTNELGKLRKFYTERQPSADETEVVRAAKLKASEGDFDSAIDMIFSQSKAAVAKANELVQAERKNSELWEEYFAERPELNRLGRQKVKDFSLKSLPLFEEGSDAFKVLDDYWMPLVKVEKPVSAKADTPPKPPVTLSGGSKPSVPSKSKETPTESFDSILDSASAYFRKKR